VRESGDPPPQRGRDRISDQERPQSVSEHQ
jgi:hypothetical protein